VLTTVYLIAITAEAMSGALAAGKRQMDMFGVVLIAFITALGGELLGQSWLERKPDFFAFKIAD
jgi:uncharacterized membrane protein YeiH